VSANAVQGIFLSIWLSLEPQMVVMGPNNSSAELINRFMGYNTKYCYNLVFIVYK